MALIRKVQVTIKKTLWERLPAAKLNDRGWERGYPLNVTLTYDETATCGWNSLKLISSTFIKLDYDNNPHPVPELATMLMLGFVLAGLAAFGRNKFIGSITPPGQAGIED